MICHVCRKEIPEGVAVYFGNVGFFQNVITCGKCIEEAAAKRAADRGIINEGG